jgi:hypothetical protein
MVPLHFLGSGRLWSPLVAPGRLWSPLVGTPTSRPSKSSGRLWSPLVASGRLWSPLVASGRLWSPLVASGRLWSPGGGRFGLKKNQNGYVIKSRQMCKSCERHDLCNRDHFLRCLNQWKKLLVFQLCTHLNTFKIFCKGSTIGV